MNPNNISSPLDFLGRVLYEDNHLIVVNKRAGEIVQGDNTGDKPLLELVRDYLRVAGNKPGNVFCGLVNRIDRPVSGAVLYAKTSKGLSRMNEMIKNRSVEKIYWAIVEGRPERAEGKLIHYVVKNEKNNKTFTSQTEKNGYQRAELEYKVLVSSVKYSLVEIRLLTGRHHQIRAQFSAIGCPIKGDLKYGARRSNEDGSICLHARRLSFEHPVAHQRVDIVAEPFNQLFYKMLQDCQKDNAAEIQN